MAILQSDGVNHTSDLILRRNGTEGLRLTPSTVQVSSINDGPLAGFRNKITNGEMLISQRATSFPGAADSGNEYTLDRWLFEKNGDVICTVSRDTSVPNNTFQNSFRVNVTTADTSVTGSEYAMIVQRIEGYNVRDLIGNTFTISFWIRSPKTGTHCVAFRNSGPPDRSQIKEYTITAANTWEFKTITVTGGLITAGNWNWTTGIGLNIAIVLAAGTSFSTTPNAWQTGNFINTTNQVNGVDSTANNYYLTGVQLEAGPVATPFERRPIGTELALCQRYYFNITFPGITFSGDFLYQSQFTFPAPMRADPTVTFSDLFTTGGNLGTWGFAQDASKFGGRFFNDANNWTALRIVSAFAQFNAEL
jgi:hypothetical protein